MTRETETIDAPPLLVVSVGFDFGNLCLIEIRVVEVCRVYLCRSLTMCDVIFVPELVVGIPVQEYRLGGTHCELSVCLVVYSVALVNEENVTARALYLAPVVYREELYDRTILKFVLIF